MTDDFRTLTARIRTSDEQMLREIANRLDLKRSEVLRRCLRLGADKLREVTLPGSLPKKD